MEQMEEAPVRLEKLSHYFGSGALRKQILFDLDAEIRAGEIVILTGPSGSGKTTALTLIGALRSAQEGSLRVLGEELCGARRETLVRVRRQAGYIFQHHNLLDALTASQNVQMSLYLDGALSRKAIRQRAEEILEAVGLGDHTSAHPGELSGGQKQRVAIARALAGEPKLILADEPTASLDRKSGRDAVGLIQDLAREHGVSVVLVTHDNRILDIADRILHLEDGRLTSFGEAVLANTRQLMGLLAEANRKGELTRHVIDMPTDQFLILLQEVTREAQEFLRISELASNDAFESMLEQVLEAFTRKIGDILRADRASLFLLDEAKGELWSKGARDAGGEFFEIRIPRHAGIAGAVVASGESLNIPDAYADPRFDSSADRVADYRTRTVLCVPLRDRQGQVFGVAEMINRLDGSPFDTRDEERFRDFMGSVGIILESWWRMSEGSSASL
jgi:putative ABC transport system ATP-binding protein